MTNSVRIGRVCSLLACAAPWLAPAMLAQDRMMSPQERLLGKMTDRFEAGVFIGSTTLAGHR